MKRMIFLAMVFLVSACAPTTKPLISVPPDLEQTLLERLHASARRISSLEGIAKVKISNAGKKVSATQVLLAEKPDRLRSEILSPFGTPAMLIATDGHELTVYIPGEGRFYRGEASDANIQRLLRIPLRLEDLVGILLYDLPVFDYRSVDAGVENNSHYLLTLEGNGAYRQEIRFDRDLQLTGARYIAEEEVVLEVDYEFLSRQPDYPQEIRVQMPQHESSVVVAFSDVENNMEISAERFLLSPPAGAEVSPFPEQR